MRNFSTYLFEREKFKKDRNEKAVRTLKRNIISVQGPIKIRNVLFYKPSLISLSKESTELYMVIDKTYQGNGQTSPKFVYKQMVNWFIKAYEFNCCVNDHKYDEDKILAFLLDFNENNIDCKNRFYNILDLIFKKKEKFIEYKNNKAKKANTTT